MSRNAFAKQRVKVELHKSKFRHVQSVIFINDEFATGSELTILFGNCQV